MFTRQGTRSAELPTQDVDAVVDYRNVSGDAVLWETYCTVGYAGPHDAETAIHNLCQVAQYCYQSPCPDQPPIIVEGPGVMTWARLGAGCALGHPDDWYIDSCTQAFYDISEKCGGRNSRRFYYGWETSKRDGSVLSINHEGYHYCDPTETPKAGVQSFC
ncbi:hypothetical protein K505DRAFT_338753 [Melanomma pulvis-pyrius CBS 109.77]|uniref:Uncharacterized protein n=1 Tax=Melanomma pulvis-pyrius CBS 109.77 TaxID=1314802 RepID=A0A6A6X7Y4_9PLEO|nr:hypothetical protein K505DRAFT_338753 [Melanomma pulvis-pyrius CBS 109.77]